VAVEQKDQVLSIFGGAVGIAGLLLIFQGYLVTAWAALPGMSLEKTRNAKKRAVRISFASVVLSVACIAVSLLWMLTSQGYQIVIGLFILTLASVVGLGAYVCFGVVA